MEQNDEQEKLKPLDAECRVDISDNHLQAFVTVLPPENGGSEVSITIVMKALREAGITYGIQLAAVQKLVKERRYEQKYIVADGIPAVNGHDGQLVNRFVFGKRGIPKMNVDGSVEYKELNLIYNVAKDQVLCDIIVPTDGTNGMSVKGQEIVAARGKDARLPLGKNVLVNKEGTEIYAGISGNLVERHNTLEIDETFVVNGDVDNSIGNIIFTGNVVVKGDVKSGFTIDAGGTVRVNGVVEAAFIKSVGDITLICGMNGKGGGSIITEGNLTAPFFENAILEAKGSITANSIMYCTVNCGGTLELKGKNGSLVGGSYVVATNLIAKAIGSPSHMQTEITLGSSTTLIEQMKIVSARLQQIESDEHKLTQAIDFLNSKDKNTLSNEKLKILDQASYSRSLIMLEKDKLASKYKQMEQELSLDNISKIICKGTIYTGTRITMNSSSITITEDRNAALVYFYENEIIFGVA